MVKLFGFRITPFFLSILGLELLVFLLSVYIGVSLYKEGGEFVATEATNRTISLGMFLFAMLVLLTPGFIFQMKIVNYLNKSINNIIFGLGVALLTLIAVTFNNFSNLNIKTMFITVLLSASIGVIATTLMSYSKYWRFLVRSGVN